MGGPSPVQAPKAGPTPAGPDMPAYEGVTGGTPAAPVAPMQPTGPNIFDQSAGWMNQAGALATPGTIASGMGTYQNPYQQQVIDNTTRQMQEAYQMADMGLGDQAAGAGAFGGARHGLAQGELAGDFTRNVGDMTAGLNQQGFNTAADLAGRDIANQFASVGALSGLANQGFNMGRTLNQDQWNMGQAAQGLQQGIMDSAQGAYGQMTPQGALTALQAALTGSPLMGNAFQRGTNTASGAEKAGTIIGSMADLAGAGRPGG